MAMAMMTTMLTITMMPPPKAASMMAGVVQALLVDAESGERPQISAGLVPDSVFQCDSR